ncbi:MAG: hypothetical protein V4560_12825 [Bacteroidota bacterium]
MKTDIIKEIKIDDLGRLCVYPAIENFYGIWQTATEVHWDIKGHFLYSPKPREWSYFDWYERIITVIKKDGFCDLKLSKQTIWTDIPEIIKEQIISF